jgi:hypothetical protein
MGIFVDILHLCRNAGLVLPSTAVLHVVIYLSDIQVHKLPYQLVYNLCHMRCDVPTAVGIVVLCAMQSTADSPARGWQLFEEISLTHLLN